LRIAGINMHSLPLLCMSCRLCPLLMAIHMVRRHNCQARCCHGGNGRDVYTLIAVGQQLHTVSQAATSGTALLIAVHSTAGSPSGVNYSIAGLHAWHAVVAWDAATHTPPEAVDSPRVARRADCLCRASP
jgi:hypothetical protein